MMDAFEERVGERERMVERQLVPRGISDGRVLAAMKRVPRHVFVPENLHAEAYTDRPLPIGRGQTISQPYMVALMTEALQVEGDESVLEIGTGSGYQAALLAELCGTLYTVERVPELSEQAKAALDSLGYRNIHYKIDDGTLGWPEHAPYDRIMVTAGAPTVPRSLIDQLAAGGKLLIPVGDRLSQELLRVVRENGGTRTEDLGGCRFVPLQGEYGWTE